VSPSYHRNRLVPLGETVTLREYVDWRFQEADKNNEREREILVKVNDERWRVNETDHMKMNEIRQQLNEQAKILARQDQVTALEQHFQTALDQLRQSRIEATDRIEQRVRQVEQFQANLTGRIAVIGVLGFVMSVGIEVALHFVK
jgi:hypothetical protein